MIYAMGILVAVLVSLMVVGLISAAIVMIAIGLSVGAMMVAGALMGPEPGEDL